MATLTMLGLLALAFAAGAVCTEEIRRSPRSRSASASRALPRHRRRRPRAGTERAVRRFQHRAGLSADGVPGARTRKALGRYGKRAPLGGRPLLVGMRGWDVAALQFALAWHGFPSGTLRRSPRIAHGWALRCFQRWAGITPDGVAGPKTFAALRGPVPVLLSPWRDRSSARSETSSVLAGTGSTPGIDFPALKGSCGRRSSLRTGRLRWLGREQLGNTRRHRPRQRRAHPLCAPLAGCRQPG